LPWGPDDVMEGAGLTFMVDDQSQDFHDTEEGSHPTQGTDPWTAGPDPWLQLQMARATAPGEVFRSQYTRDPWRTYGPVRVGMTSSQRTPDAVCEASWTKTDKSVGESSRLQRLLPQYLHKLPLPRFSREHPCRAGSLQTLHWLIGIEARFCRIGMLTVFYSNRFILVRPRNITSREKRGIPLGRPSFPRTSCSDTRTGSMPLCQVPPDQDRDHFPRHQQARSMYHLSRWFSNSGSPST
jgi:hypothetical protein